MYNVIIIYDQAYFSGGAAKIAIGSAIALKKIGYNVVFFSAVGPISQELIDEQIEVICLNEKHIALTKNPISLLKGIWNNHAKKELYKILNRFDPNNTIVHIHGWTKALSSSIFQATYNKGFKTLITLHEYFTICPNGGIYNYKKKLICNIQPNTCKCYLCNCDKRNFLQKLYRDLRQIIQNHIFKKTCPICIYISTFSRNIIEPLLPFNSKSYNLVNHVEVSKNERISVENNSIYLFIGRISYEKGIDLFCECMRQSNNKGLVIGDGQLKQTYEKLYPEITFVGWKKSNEIYDYLVNARCLIITSKWYETMGLTTIEMQQYGIPCIVPKQCAASEYIKNNITGLYYDTGSVNSLLECIYKTNDINFLKKISLNFYNSFNINKYSIETHINKLNKIYLEVLNESTSYSSWT